MNISDLSPWFYVVALLFSGAAAAVFALIDRRTLQQLLKTLALLAGEIAGMAIIAWGCSKWSNWWALALPAVIIFAAHLLWAVREGVETYRRSRLHTRQHYEYLLGNGATRLEALMPSIRRSLRAAVVTLLHDWSRILTSGPLLLLLGMLLGGALPVAAAIATLLFALILLGTTTLTCIICIWYLEKRHAI